MTQRTAAATLQHAAGLGAGDTATLDHEVLSENGRLFDPEDDGP